MFRVLIFDEAPLFAHAHRSYVARVPEFVVHGVVHSGNAAVRAVTAANATDQPTDLVLLDIGLPDARGLDVASASVGLRPSADLIVLTAAQDLEVSDGRTWCQDHVCPVVLISLVGGVVKKKQMETHE